MTIDIIDLGDPQYADLSPVQLSMVRVAQGKKDAILAKANDAVRQLIYLLTANDIARSTVRERERARIEAQAEADVETVREDRRATNSARTAIPRTRITISPIRSAFSSSGITIWRSHPIRTPDCRRTRETRLRAPISESFIKRSTSCSLPIAELRNFAARATARAATLYLARYKILHDSPN